MHGRPSRTPSDKEAKRIAAAYRAGVPLRGLQDRFGFSVDVIKRVLADAGIEIEQRRRGVWGLEQV